MDIVLQFTFSVNCKSYLPLLTSEKIKFLTNLYGDLYILMHQINKYLNQNLFLIYLFTFYLRKLNFVHRLLF